MTTPRIDRMEASALIAGLANKDVTTWADVGTVAAPFTAIVNRAPLTDLANDCNMRFGIERIPVQSIFQMQNEFGANGEPVFGVLNDDRGMIRFVGAGWTAKNDGYGPRVESGLPIGINDYVEITFYGTGLSCLTLANDNTKNVVVSVDGGTEGSNMFPTAESAILSNRNYSQNQVKSIVSGLTLGIHTVKMRIAASFNFGVAGFEIQNSSMKIQPGTVIGNKRKNTLLTQQSPTYNSVATGTKGGRVLTYLNVDGTFGQAFTACAASPLYLTSSNHSSEEIARSFSPREFGAARSDDFSLVTSASALNLTFTLDDGTTSLTGNQVNIGFVNNIEALHLSSTGSSCTFTFVGTGLDIEQRDGAAGTLDTYSVTVDGTVQGNLSTTASTSRRIVKICSGLPYGTHTVKILRTVISQQWLGIVRFIVYQPVKPALPTNSVELSDYCVMANYVANSTMSALTAGTGVLRKAQSREMTYVGTGWISAIDTASIAGWLFYSSTTNDYCQYSFFGTGLDLRFQSPGSTTTWQVNIDGSTNFSTATTSNYGTGITSFVAATGVITTSGTATQGNGVSISGLTLGFHTVKITRTGGTGTLYFDAMDIITPVYSYKSNLYADLQNTLNVGSNSVSSSIRSSQLPATTKAWAQAVGVISTPSTTSTSSIPMPDMSVTIKTTGGPVQVAYSAMLSNTTVNNHTYAYIYVDGAKASKGSFYQSYTGGAPAGTAAETVIIPMSAGTHKIDVYYNVEGNTGYAMGDNRTLTVREL